jgi:voltage-gated potassium channel
MVALGVILYQFYKRVRIVFGNPELRGLFLFTAVIVLLGAIFYHKVEGWNLLNSLYFTVITLTTIGYGDFVPITPVGKIFTMLYVFLGLGVLAMFISTVAEYSLKEQRQQRELKMAQKGVQQEQESQEGS